MDIVAVIVIVIVGGVLVYLFIKREEPSFVPVPKPVPSPKPLPKPIRQPAPEPWELAKQRLAAVRDFSEFIGQSECVRRLKAFGDLYQSRGEAPEHILLTGADGIGKLRLAQAFAKTYSVGLTESSAESFEKRGDLTATITSLEPRTALIVRNIQALRRPIAEVLQAALHEFRVDLIIGVGPGARIHPYQLNRFTCIATAPKPSDIHPELLKCFSLSLELQPYRDSELESIVRRFARENGLILQEGAARQLASVSEGNPGTIELLVKRFSRLGKAVVTAEEAEQILGAFGYNVRPLPHDGDQTKVGDLNALTGVEFEKLINDLLQKMGFRAEMTRATGDGGIDIVAHLQTDFIGGRYLIQCKRFTDTLVGAPMIREFYGAVVADRRALKGIFVTTSGFTDQAREFAQNLPLELIDGNQLKRLLAQDFPVVRPPLQRRPGLF